MAQEDTTMFKRVWKDEEAVSPVIATILMVAITVVLAGVLVVYMNQFQLNNDPPTNASSVATPFSNPVDGSRTSNGGGWSVKVISVSGHRPNWGEVTVQLSKNDIPVARMAKVKAASATFYQINGTESMKWYALGAGGTMSYSHNGGAKTAITTTMTAGDFESLENVYFCVVDIDGNGVLDAGDLVEVYASNNADTAVDVGGAGWSLDITIGGNMICSSDLA
jgi:flagellin-like protein